LGDIFCFHFQGSFYYPENWGNRLRRNGVTL